MGLTPSHIGRDAEGKTTPLGETRQDYQSSRSDFESHQETAVQCQTHLDSVHFGVQPQHAAK